MTYNRLGIEAGEAGGAMWTAKRAPFAVIALVVLAQVFFDALFNLVIFKQGWLRPIYFATHGLINLTLIANAILLGIVVIGMIVRIGRLRAHDLGLSWAGLRAAALFALALWAAVNLGVIGFWLAAGKTLAIDPAWQKPLANIGDFLAQIFGNALYEEIVYRGFLTVQIALLLQRFGKTAAVIGGGFIAQAIFAVIHVPMLIVTGNNWAQIADLLPQVFAIGCILAAIYLITGNLLLAVAAHALTDAYMLIFAAPMETSDSANFVYSMLALLLVGGWWAMQGRKEKGAGVATGPL